MLSRVTTKNSKNSHIPKKVAIQSRYIHDGFITFHDYIFDQIHDHDRQICQSRYFFALLDHDFTLKFQTKSRSRQAKQALHEFTVDPIPPCELAPELKYCEVYMNCVCGGRQRKSQAKEDGRPLQRLVWLLFANWLLPYISRSLPY